MKDLGVGYRNESRMHNFNTALSSARMIENKAGYVSEELGVPLEEIYRKIGLDKDTYIRDFTSNADGIDFRQKEAMLDLDLYKGWIVPKEHKKYGGIMPEMLRNEEAIFGFFEKPRTTEGEVEEGAVGKGIIGGILDWAGKHPYLSAGGLIALFFGGVAANEYVNNKKFANYVDEGIAKAKAEISGASPAVITAAESQVIAKSPAFVGVNGSGEKAVGGDVKAELTPHEKLRAELYGPLEKIKVNATANSTEQVVLGTQPKIRGSVMNMFYVMEKYTPQFYNEIMPYLNGTTILPTTDDNYYSSESNEIYLNIVSIDGGGSDDLKLQLAANANLYAEAMGIKADITGEGKQFKTYYEGELFQHSNKAKYRVAAGIDIKEEANAWLKRNGWFRAITGRDVTPKDLEGVDINKYLIK